MTQQILNEFVYEFQNEFAYVSLGIVVWARHSTSVLARKVSEAHVASQARIMAAKATTTSAISVLPALWLAAPVTVYVCVYIYIYIYIYISLSLSLSLYIYIYIYMCIYIVIYIYMCVYVYILCSNFSARVRVKRIALAL